MWNRCKSFLSVFFILFVLGLCGFGIRRAVHSSLFTLTVVEWVSLQDTQEDAEPLRDISKAMDEAHLKVGKISLFDLDLASIESEILQNDWVESVELAKRFPQTLEIRVEVRKPAALIQKSDGTVSYVSSKGREFSILNLKEQVDLPILTGDFAAGSVETRLEALGFLQEWKKMCEYAVSSIHVDSEKGYSIWTQIDSKRIQINFGDSLNPEFTQIKLQRLSKVVQYLRREGKILTAKLITIENEKKIIVKGETPS